MVGLSPPSLILECLGDATAGPVSVSAGSALHCSVLVIVDNQLPLVALTKSFCRPRARKSPRNG